MIRLKLAQFGITWMLAMAASVTQAANLISDSHWNLFRPNAGDAEARYVEEPSLNGAKAWIVTVTNPSRPFYLIQLSQTIASGFEEGQRLRFRFKARSLDSCSVRAAAELNAPPYDAFMDRRIILTPVWKEYEIKGVASKAAPNHYGLRLQIGEKAGTLEFADMSLENLGIDPEIRDARAAIQPDQIKARIEKYRMGEMKILAKDASGKPVPNASVKIEQTRSAFLFGCDLFGLKEEDSSDKQKAYRERFTAQFNYATLPFYWGGFETEEGKPYYHSLDFMARWCHDHGIEPKGHPLVWHEVYPKWASNDPDIIVPRLQRRVNDIVTHYRSQIRYWDIVNEANYALAYEPPNGESLWIKRVGPAFALETPLGCAREAGKGAPESFIYNDFDTSQNNLDLWEKMKADGRMPDVIGLQSHMHSGTWPLEKLWQVCESFSRFKKPIHFTETTVVSGPMRSFNYATPPADWKTTPEGEAAQADYVARFYSILFSHPSVKAITWWDLSDAGAWMNAPAGLIRSDMSPKPAYERLMDLIHHQWRTNAHESTNAKGECELRAFYGDYRITVTDPGGRRIERDVTLPDGSGEKEFVMTLR